MFEKYVISNKELWYIAHIYAFWSLVITFGCSIAAHYVSFFYSFIVWVALECLIRQVNDKQLYIIDFLVRFISTIIGAYIAIYIMNNFISFSFFNTII